MPRPPAVSGVRWTGPEWGTWLLRRRSVVERSEGHSSDGAQVHDARPALNTDSQARESQLPHFRQQRRQPKDAHPDPTPHGARRPIYEDRASHRAPKVEYKLTPLGMALARHFAAYGSGQ